MRVWPLLAVVAVSALHSAAASNNCHWMRDMWQVVSNRTLKHLTLPGTHDSGAYNLTSRLEPGDSASPLLDDIIKIAEDVGIPIEDLITPWGRAQDESFYGQGVGGIRYFDFRAGFNGTDWVTFHFEQGHLAQVLLNDLRRFMDATTHEVIVVEVSHTSANATQQDKDRLATMIVDTLGPYLCPRSVGFVPLSQLVAAGTRAVVTLDDDTTIQKFPGLWSGDSILNSYADSPVLNTMVSYNDGKVHEFQSYTGDALYKISWTLTPNADAILKGFVPGNPDSLIKLADTAAPVLSTWSPKYLNAGMPLANIVIIDHFETSAITTVAAKSSMLQFPGTQ